MLLWIGFALMTAAALVAVLRPLVRPPAGRPLDAGALDVYRHQLDELEADRARGIIEEPEAAAARIEVSRRLLASAASQASAPVSRAPALPDRATLALAVAVCVPVAALALYLTYGSPNLPAFPFAERARLSPEQMRTDDLIARVEARLREHPEDGAGWDVIAPVYLKLGRYRDASAAFASASRLLGETASRLAGFAQASVLAANGIVTEDARLAYERILKIDPGHIEARIWLAVAKEQDGKLTQARADYEALLAQAPPSAPWRSPLEQRVAGLTRRLGGSPATETRGPSAEDVAAAERLPPAERRQMIARMVDGLAQRLERDGRDLGGWQRLVDAYVVLGRTDDARKALTQARKSFAQDADALATLKRLADRLGLGS